MKRSRIEGYFILCLTPTLKSNLLWCAIATESGRKKSCESTLQLQRFHFYVMYTFVRSFIHFSPSHFPFFIQQFNLIYYIVQTPFFVVAAIVTVRNRFHLYLLYLLCYRTFNLSVCSALFVSLIHLLSLSFG